jgi:hypothetical protein
MTSAFVSSYAFYFSLLSILMLPRQRIPFFIFSLRIAYEERVKHWHWDRKSTRNIKRGTRTNTGEEPFPSRYRVT